MKTFFKTSMILFFVLLLSPMWAQGAFITFELDTEFSGADEPAGNKPWIKAIFDDGDTPGSVLLTLTSDNLINDEFITEWYFNFDPALDLNLLTIDHTGGVSATSNKNIDHHKADGDGYFDILFNFSNAPKNKRFTEEKNATFQISSSEEILASSFNYPSVNGSDPQKNGIYSAAKIQGIGDNGEGSGWIGDMDGGGASGFEEPDPDPIPEPSTILLLGMGLALLGWRGRKLSGH